MFGGLYVRPAISEGDNHIVIQGDFDVMVPGLGELFHCRDPLNLTLQYQQGHTGELQLLPEPGMVKIGATLSNGADQ